jgi:UDP-glucose 4-epimerase
MQKNRVFNMKKLLISGISGFIGSHAAQKGLDNGYDVYGLVRQKVESSPALESLKGKVKFYEGDLNDFSNLTNIIRDIMPDYVIHLGAITPVAYSFDHPWEVFQTNAVGTVNICENLRRHVPNLKKFIFASSMETYGHKPWHRKYFLPFDEKTSQMGACPYAVAKIAAEHYVKYLHYSYDFPSVSLRQTNTYGRKHNDYFVVEAFVTAMLRNKDAVDFGDPRPVRNFLYIDDLTDLYFRIFDDGGGGLLGNSYCVGPANGITIEQLAGLIRHKLDWKGKINWYTREHRAGEIFYLNSSAKLLYDTIGWKPSVSLSDGLDKVIEYWKSKLSV